MRNEVNELIEQIGGRKRLDQIASFDEDAGLYPNISQCKLMASALLAVMDAQENPSAWIINCSSERINFAETEKTSVDKIIEECRENGTDIDITPLYTAPPAGSVNYPAIPEDWIPMPRKLTAENGAKAALSGDFTEHKFINCSECFGDDECESCDGSGRIKVEVTVSWSTIKAIWEKGADHFAAAPAPGGEK